MAKKTKPKTSDKPTPKGGAFDAFISKALKGADERTRAKRKGEKKPGT